MNVLSAPCDPGHGAPAAIDWAGTELADPALRPACLQLTMDIMLNSPLASLLMWGPQQIMLFNQAYVQLLGSKQLRVPGGKVPALRPAPWNCNPPAIEAAWHGAASAWRQQTLQIWRDGASHEHLLDLYYTPIADEHAQVQGILCNIVPSLAPPAATPAAAALRVLVVEDNPDAQFLVCEMLRSLGHAVQAADSGEFATPLLEAQRFDVLFTDVSLPGISGVDLARAALRRQSDLEIVFASGFGDLLTKHLEFAATSLQKPYDLDLLQYTLSNISLKLHAHGV